MKKNNILAIVLSIIFAQSFLVAQNISSTNETSMLVVGRKKSHEDNPLINKFFDKFKDTDILAYVDDHPIVFADIKAWYKNMLNNYTNMYKDIPLTSLIAKNFLKECTEKAIFRYFTAEEIRKKNLFPSKEECQKKFEEFKKKNFPSELDFLNYLIINGCSKEQFEIDFNFQTAVDAFQLYANKKLKNLTDADAKKWYTENISKFKIPRFIKFQIILLKNSDTSDVVRKKNFEIIAKIRNDIESGKKTFAFYAKNFSDDDNRKKGGIYELSSVETLKEFFYPLKTLPKGKLSQIYDYKEGFYIAEILDEKPETVEKFDTVKDELKKMLTEKRNTDNALKIVQDAKAKSKIKFLDINL